MCASFGPELKLFGSPKLCHFQDQIIPILNLFLLSFLKTPPKLPIIIGTALRCAVSNPLINSEVSKDGYIAVAGELQQVFILFLYVFVIYQLLY